MIERYRLAGDVTIGTGILANEVADFVSTIGGTGVVIGGRSGLTEVAWVPHAPTVDASGIRTAAALASAAAADHLAAASWIVAVGGAATLDVAKLLRFRTRAGSNPFDGSQSIAELQQRLDQDQAYPLPLLVAPGVIGSGAEVSALSDVLRTPRGTKVPVIHRDVVPTRAVVDSALVSQAPTEVRAATAFDAAMHLLDPWLGSLPAGPQANASEAALAVLLRTVLSCDDPANVAAFTRASHLAITPGLARVGGHASCAHRIEHAVPDGVFETHGAGLLWVAVRLLRWAEASRPEQLRPFADALARAFGRAAMPSALLAELGEELGVTPGPACLPADAVEEAVAGLSEQFVTAGSLPGTLGIAPDDARSILSSEEPARPGSLPLVRSAPPDGIKVFGRPAPERIAKWVVSPAPLVASSFEGDLGALPSWFQTRVSQHDDGSTLMVGTTPGASALRDCLDLLASWLPLPREVLFLGLAGSLTERLRVGEWTPVQPLPTGCDPRPPVDAGSAGAFIASVHALEDESPRLFDFMRWRGAELVDLEADTFFEWSRRRGIAARAAVVVSDDPYCGTPLWAVPRTSPNAELVATSSQEMVRRLCSTSRTGR